MLKKLIILVSLIAIAMLTVSAFRTEQVTAVKIVTPVRGDIESVIRVTGKVINDHTIASGYLPARRARAAALHRVEALRYE